MAKPTSLEIHNYKCFQNLKLEAVGHVNLIAGKNNVGKTTLLEAVALVASGTDPKELFRTLDDRERPTTERSLEQSFDRVFLSGHCRIRFEPLRINIAKPAEEPDDAQDPTRTDFRRDSRSKLVPSFSLQSGFYNAQFDLDFATRKAASLGQLKEKIARPAYPKYQWVSGLNWESSRVRSLWDAINGLPAEDNLVELLRVLDAQVERVTLPTSEDQTLPRIRKAGSQELEPISRFGEGMTRLFYMGLALLNATGGILLVDEIENGLHHSLFPKLWEFLFRSAEALNVTIFATTHSHDATKSFAKRAIMFPKSTGVMTRLDQTKKGIVAVQYGDEEALIAAEEGYEVR